jgi:hypothetical protein
MPLPFCTGKGSATIRAGGMHATVSLQRLDLPLYTGPRPNSAWRKRVVGLPDRPFAELQLVARLEQAGWCAAWVYRPGKFISSWEPRCPAVMPDPAQALFDKISRSAGSQAGCWDVFAWHDRQPLFVELKRAGSSDRIRETQLAWRQAAVAVGVPDESFVLVEWREGDEHDGIARGPLAGGPAGGRRRR